jgi:hypothetical protein
VILVPNESSRATAERSKRDARTVTQPAPTERNSNPSRQRRALRPVRRRRLRTDRHTLTRPRAQRIVTPPATRSSAGVRTPVTVRSCRGGGSGGRRLPPPGVLATWIARGGVVQLGRDARRSSANVRHPPPCRSTRRSHSRLTACPAPRPPATHRGRVVDAPSARAASLASSAALPRPPVDPRNRPSFRASTPTSMGTSTPTSFPTRWGCVPLGSVAEAVGPAQAP